MLPILFQNPELTLYSYPLFMGLGWGIAYQIYFGLVPDNLPRRFPIALFWGVFAFAWLGAKLLFYFTVPQAISRELLMQTSFWLGGGFVFYGGFIGGLLFLIIYKSLGFSLNLNLLWPMVPALSIGHGIGRIGCTLAGCCYGELTDWWWGIQLHGHDRHPTQILEAFGLIMLGIYLLKSSKLKKTLIAHYLIIYGIIRIGIESLRGDIIRGLWGPLTPSQWISFALITSGLTLLVRHRKDRGPRNNQPL